MFEPKPVSLMTLMQVSSRHFSMAVRIASTCFALLAFSGLVVLKLLGMGMSPHPIVLMIKFKILILRHKIIAAVVYFILFALPGNLTALWVLMSYQFKDYQIFPVYVQPVMPHLPYGIKRSGRVEVQKRRSRVLTFFINLEKGCEELYDWLIRSHKQA